MPSIASLTGSTSSTSSIYGNRTTNIISGLASGLDTEAMIEGLVQSYQQKITGLQQDRTKLQWQQSAYQSISDKLVEFARKYTSYTSSTNLLSSSFFNNAVITTTNGTYAGLVSASGKTSSSVSINAVAQLATAAKYTVNNDKLGGLASGVISSKPVDLTDETTVSTMDGSLSLTYGNQSVTINFGELELFAKDDDSGLVDMGKLTDAIKQKLSEQEISINGTTYTADKVIGIEFNDKGAISLTDKLGANNRVAISGATGNFADRISGLDSAVKNKASSFSININGAPTKKVSTADYLSDKTFTVTLNGQTKTFTLDGLPEKSNNFAQDVVKTLNEKLDEAFGTDKIKVNLVDVTKEDGSLTGEKALSFQVNGSGNTFSISSQAGELLGMDDGALTSYLDASKSLSDLLGVDENGALEGLEALKGVGTITERDGKRYDEAGNRVDEQGYLLNADGKRLYGLTINGVSVGKYTADTALETVINGINNSDAGVNVSYSKLTNQFVFTAKETGEGGRIEIETTTNAGSKENTNLAEALFGSVSPTKDTNGKYPEGYTVGQDAVFQATVNGNTMTFTRSSNTFDIDGMSVTLNGTFNAAEGNGTPLTSQGIASMTEEEQNGLYIPGGEAVTFTSKTDADTIVDAVKSMVEDYNAIMQEVKKAYSDMPLEKSDGSHYEPLTDEDRADMSESAIKEYEEKAKTGILFMDSDLSSLYNSLRSAITPGGAGGSFLRSIGIKTAYSDGLTTLTLDEEALRQALETNPDQVRDAFTKSKEYGSGTDGLMTAIQKITDRYAATTGATKGILIEKAGSQYSPTAALDNTMLDQMEEIDEEIERWQDKMSDQVDYYTNQFTRLEMLINQMNSQSSALAGLMGGY